MTQNPFDPERRPVWLILKRQAPPGHYTAELWHSRPTMEQTTASMGDTDLAALRTRILMQGASKLEPAPGGDPDVLETWLL